MGFSFQVSHDRLYKPVASIANSAERKIFLSDSGSLPASVKSLQSSTRLYNVAMGVLVSQGVFSSKDDLLCRWIETFTFRGCGLGFCSKGGRSFALLIYSSSSGWRISDLDCRHGG